MSKGLKIRNICDFCTSTDHVYYYKDKVTNSGFVYISYHSPFALKFIVKTNPIAHDTVFSPFNIEFTLWRYIFLLNRNSNSPVIHYFNRTFHNFYRHFEVPEDRSPEVNIDLQVSMRTKGKITPFLLFYGPQYNTRRIVI